MIKMKTQKQQWQELVKAVKKTSVKFYIKGHYETLSDIKGNRQEPNVFNRSKTAYEDLKSNAYIEDKKSFTQEGESNNDFDVIHFKDNDTLEEFIQVAKNHDLSFFVFDKKIVIFFNKDSWYFSTCMKECTRGMVK